MNTKLSIFQMVTTSETIGVKFHGAEKVLSFFGESLPDFYMKRWGGELEVKTLEDIFAIFNGRVVNGQKMPTDYATYSLSVTDIIVVEASDSINPGAYMVDRAGFRRIDFKPDTINVVYVESLTAAHVVGIPKTLHGMQVAVEGLIEACYIGIDDEDDVCLVCNDEGKFIGLSPNREIKDDNGNRVDIIFGNFFIASASGENDNFGSLNRELAEKYLKRYFNPDVFNCRNGQIISEKLKMNCEPVVGNWVV